MEYPARFYTPIRNVLVVRLITIFFVFLVLLIGDSRAQEMNEIGAIYGPLTDEEHRFRSDASEISRLLADKLITYQEFQEIHKTYKLWLAQRTKEAKRPHLGFPHRPPIGLDAEAIQNKFEAKSHLNGEALIGLDIRWANLVGAHINGADLSGSGVKADPSTFTPHTDLSSVNLIGAQIRSAKAKQALLRQSVLVGVDFTESDLSGAVLWQADLRWAKFDGANLTDADFWQANVAGVIFEPKSKSLPDIGKFASVIGLAQLTYNQNPAGLIELRKAFVDAGFAKQARQATYAIRRAARKKKWEGSFVERIESAFEYVMFELPSAYGMSPLRPLVILLFLIPVFSVFYFFTSLSSHGGSIWLNRSESWINRKPLKKWIAMRWRRGTPPIGEILKVARIALWFSLLSAFSVGFREFSIGDWLVRLQRQPYVLGATGWCRTVAGFQSLVSLYLVALTILSYFGSPF